MSDEDLSIDLGDFWGELSWECEPSPAQDRGWCRRDTPVVHAGDEIHSDLEEVDRILKPFLDYLDTFQRREKDVVLCENGDRILTLTDLRRIREIGVRLNLIRMGVRSLEARVQSTTDPRFLKIVK